MTVYRNTLHCSAPQDGLSGSRVCKSDILERLDAPDTFPSSDYREDQRIDIVRTIRVGRAATEAAPEVDNCHAIADRAGVDEFVLKGGIPIDRSMQRLMEGDNLVDTADVMSKPVDEGRIRMKKRSERRHVVRIPGGLKCRRRFLGAVDGRHGVLRRSIIPVILQRENGRTCILSERDRQRAEHS